MIEDLEKNLHAAEDVCPGITDEMISHILERVHRCVGASHTAVLSETRE